MSDSKLASKSTYFQVITLQVSRNTKWVPSIAENLMISLFSIFEPISLIIKATTEGISWQIEIPYQQVEAVERLIYAVYPEAQLDVSPKSSTSVGAYRFPFMAGRAFLYHIKSVSDIPDLDPLAAISSAMGAVGENEILTYEVRLRTVRENYYDLGVEKYEEMLKIFRPGDKRLKLAEDKLQTLLKEVEVVFKLQVSNEQRANQLINTLIPPLAIFDVNGGNFIVPASDRQSFGLILSASEAASLWHLPTEQCKAPLIKWARGATAPSPQHDGSNKEHISLGVNKFQGTEQVAKLAYRDRISHVNLLGGTGVGKSTSMHHMIHQDILAGKSVGVIDPHGNLVQNILRSSIPADREKDVVLLDIHDTNYPVGLNLLKAPPNVSREEVASQTVSVIRKIFADYWSPTRMETALYAALTTLMSVENSTIMDVPRLFHDSDFRSQFYSETTDPIALQYWLYQYEPATWKQKNEIAAPIMHRLSKFYTNPTLRNMVCQTTSLDFAAMLDQRPIFLANLGGMPDIEAETLGALLISKLQIAGMSRGVVEENSIGSFYLYIDEVQNFSTTSLPVLFSGARKNGLSLVVANQYLHQLEGETLEAVLGNVGTSIIFRVGPKDATVVAPYVKPYFTNSDLESMGRFRAVVKMQDNAESVPAFNIQTYAPLPPHDDAEEQIERIKAHSRSQYARKREEVEREIAKRLLASRPSTAVAGDEEEDDEEEDSYLG